MMILMAVVKGSEPPGEGASHDDEVDSIVDDIYIDGGGGGQYYVDLLLFLLKSEFLTLILTELLTF